VKPPDLPDVTPAVGRPPRIGLRFLSWFILSALIGYGLWAWIGSLWAAIPGGLVGGYVVVILLIAFGERGRDGCLPKPPPPSP